MTTEQRIQQFLYKGEIVEIGKQLFNVSEWTLELIVMQMLIQVFKREVEADISPTVFDYSVNLDELTLHFVRFKLYMRRLEFSMPEECLDEVYDYCVETGVSDFLILYILDNHIFLKKQCCGNLALLFQTREGTDSIRAQKYLELERCIE